MVTTEKTVESKVVYEGRIFRVKRDLAALPYGKLVGREVVEHPGGVAILPVDENRRVIAVRQFRYPLMKEMLEIPAGKLERGEDPRLCAERELSEETGMEAKTLIYLGSIYPSPGFCDEQLYLYLALDLVSGEAHPDEDELLNTVFIPFEQFEAFILSNQIQDAKTMAAVYLAKKHLTEDA